MFFNTGFFPLELSKEVLKYLSDKDLISELSIVSKKGQEIILEILFERNSPVAWIFQEKYIRRYIAGKQKSNNEAQPEVLTKFCDKKAAADWPVPLILLQQCLKLSEQWTPKDVLIFNLASFCETFEGLLFCDDVQQKKIWKKISDGLKDTSNTVSEKFYQVIATYLKYAHSMPEDAYTEIWKFLENKSIDLKETLKIAYEVMSVYLTYCKSIPEDAYQKIYNGLNHEDRFVRAAAYKAMMAYLTHPQFMPKNIYEKLCKLLKDNHDYVRKAAYEAIIVYLTRSKSVPEGIYQKIYDGLEDQKHLVREVAYKAMMIYLRHSKSEPENAYEKIYDGLKDEIKSVRAVVYKAMITYLTHPKFISAYTKICELLKNDNEGMHQLAYDAMTVYLVHIKSVPEGTYEKIYDGLINSKQLNTYYSAEEAMIAYLTHPQFISNDAYVKICKLLEDNQLACSTGYDALTAYLKCCPSIPEDLYQKVCDGLAHKVIKTRATAYKAMAAYLKRCSSIPEDVYKRICDGLGDNNDESICEAAYKAMTVYLTRCQSAPENVYKEISSGLKSEDNFVRIAAYDVMTVYLTHAKSLPKDAYEKICDGLRDHNDKFICMAAYKAMAVYLTRCQSVSEDVWGNICDGLIVKKSNLIGGSDYQKCMVSPEVIKALTDFVLKQPVEEQTKLLVQIIDRLDPDVIQVNLYKLILLISIQIKNSNSCFISLNTALDKNIEKWLSVDTLKQCNMKYLLIQAIEEKILPIASLRNSL